MMIGEKKKIARVLGISHAQTIVIFREVDLFCIYQRIKNVRGAKKRREERKIKSLRDADLQAVHLYMGISSLNNARLQLFCTRRFFTRTQPSLKQLPFMHFFSLHIVCAFLYKFHVNN